MNTVHIWIDADSCPRMVRSYVLRYARQLALPVTLVANRTILPQPDETFEMVICPAEHDAADDYIFDHASSPDMIITRDIPLAARCVDKGFCVLNDRGTAYTKENVRERLSERDFDLQLAQIGLAGNKANTYGKKEFAAFACCFDKEIHRLIRNAKLS